LHVSYPSPWNLVADFVAKRGEIPENSIWRASLKYGRTIYDADYTLESGYFKLNVVYIESGE